MNSYELYSRIVTKNQPKEMLTKPEIEKVKPYTTEFLIKTKNGPRMPKNLLPQIFTL